MSSKVTCSSCGHSWNKSDSSKKDANVCHICGKDNTMKNGGWLDKYNDGGPVQPNYNDYSVSAPEGFQGDGYINVGRNYSPAWGGQFKNGGELPTAQVGTILPNVTVKSKKKQPIYVTNPRDARLKAYKDSLSLYNEGEKNYKERLEFNKKNNVPKSSTRKWNNPVDYYMDKKGDMQLSKIQPIEGNGYWFNEKPDNVVGTNVPGRLVDNYGFRYKKPTQPVEYINRIRQTETPKLQDLPMGLSVNISLPELRRPAGPNRITMGKPLFPGGPQTDYYTPIDEAGNVVQSPEFKTRQFAMGGSLPGATGSMYARVGAPSKGPHRNQTDVTDASAQNGAEMKYYQEGLDWKPKSISKNGSVIKDDRGQWDYPGEITQIGSNQITMQGVPYPVMGISDTGDIQMMYPNKDYVYDGESVTEYPMMKEGGALQLTKLDQLTNFTNYNKPTKGGWLDKYK